MSALTNLQQMKTRLQSWIEHHQKQMRELGTERPRYQYHQNLKENYEYLLNLVNSTEAEIMTHYQYLSIIDRDLERIRRDISKY